MSEVAEQLSARQEAFCAAYVRLGSAAAAARRAGYSDGAAKSQGWRLLQDPKVRARLDELRRTEGGPTGGGVDLAGLMAKLEAVYDDARRHREYNSAVRAVEAQARLLERFGAAAATPETEPAVPDAADAPDGGAPAGESAPEREPPPGDGPPHDLPPDDGTADGGPPPGDGDPADPAEPGMAPESSAIGDPPMGAGPIRDPGVRFAATAPGARPARGIVDPGQRERGLGWLAACIRVDLGQHRLARKLRHLRADMLAQVVEKYERRFGLPVPSVAGC